MLVKELRQGLRTRSFVAVFMALQAILAVVLLAAGAGAAMNNSGQTISNIIFIFFSIAVIIIQPMRGIAALSSEVKGNTIDMMVLTRLSAWRIVTGKWFAIVTQSALILVTIIPYLILRYFFGGMNLFGEIMFLALLFLTSATLTAITVGLSASGSVILRSVLPMIALPIGAYSMLVGLMFGMSGSRGGGLAEMVSLSTTQSQIGVSLYLSTCAYAAFYFLSVGTSLIAPYAENHSTLRRLISLGVTCVAAILASMDFTGRDFLPVIFTLILAPVFAISLTEFAPLSAPTYTRFAKSGPAGKLAGFFLFPGWPSGVFFCVTLSLISAIPFLVKVNSGYSGNYLVYGVISLASLLFPAVLVNLFRTQGPQRVSNYVLILLTSGILASVLSGIAESMSNRGFLWIFVWIPPVLFALQAMSRSDDAVLITSTTITLLFFGILIILALKHYRKSITDIEHSIGSL